MANEKYLLYYPFLVRSYLSSLYDLRTYVALKQAPNWRGDVPYPNPNPNPNPESNVKYSSQS